MKTKDKTRRAAHCGRLRRSRRIPVHRPAKVINPDHPATPFDPLFEALRDELGL